MTSNARHAWRKMSGSDEIVLILTIKKMGQFFVEIGRSTDNNSLPTPTQHDLVHFVAVSKRYGYWNASYEENEMVGIHMSF